MHKSWPHLKTLLNVHYPKIGLSYDPEVRYKRYNIWAYNPTRESLSNIIFQRGQHN